MSAPLSEILKWKYHTRELQADTIVEQASKGINAEFETNSNQFRILETLLRTPPIFLDSAIKNFQESEENFYTKASTALRILAKKARILNVLTRLAKACGEEASGIKEIAIDYVDITTPLHIRLVFRNREEMLEQVVSEGRKEAANKVLDLTQSEIPLIRYRRDLAIRKFPLSPTIDQGLLGYVPTRLDSVDLKLWYSKTEILPHLSFRVRPF